MKNKLILIASLCFLSSILKAQDTLTYYCKENGNKTVKDSASFLRKTFHSNGLWYVSDFYLDGTTKVNGTYNGSNERMGHFAFYDKAGIKIKEGNYYRSYKIGRWKTWYDDKHVKSNENFSQDTLLIDKVLKDGIANVKLFKVDVAEYFSNSKGIYQDTSKWYYLNGNISQEEIWDKTLKYVSIGDESGKITHPKIDENDWSNNLFVIPIFNGNLKKLAKENGLMDAYKNLSESKDHQFVTFRMESNGNLSHVSGSRKLSVTEYIDMERLLSTTKGMWIIGRQHNQIGDFNLSFGEETSYTGIKLTSRLKPTPVIYE